jgi:hypothetical protein
MKKVEVTVTPRTDLRLFNLSLGLNLPLMLADVFSILLEHPFDGAAGRRI